MRRACLPGLAAAASAMAAGAGGADARPPGAEVAPHVVGEALVWSVPVFHTFDGPLRGLNNLLTMADGNQLGIMMPTEEVPTPELLKAMQSGPEQAPE